MTVENQDSDIKSKTKIKKEMLALQDLGEQLVQLSFEQLEQLSLPFQLLQAVKDAKKIKSHGGKRRQFQYIGRLMREIDVSSIKEFFESINLKHQQSNAQFHRLENIREELISGDKISLDTFLQNFPHADRQHLRQLIANAKKERLHGKPVGASRALFRYIRNLESHSIVERD